METRVCVPPTFGLVYKTVTCIRLTLHIRLEGTTTNESSNFIYMHTHHIAIAHAQIHYFYEPACINPYLAFATRYTYLHIHISS